LVLGFVPSYELDSDIGKKIARLKGLEKGWHYPTFLLYYIRNPGPLLLFDEIIIDEGAARKAIEYVSGPRKKPHNYEGSVISKLKPTNNEIEAFRQLIGSELFKKSRIVEMITDGDFDRIEQGYRQDLGMSSRYLTHAHKFKKAVSVMEKRYGPYYALPDPQRFEAMNINLTWVLLEKLSAIPLDDILRSPLYEYKTVQTASQMRLSGTAYKMINQARQVLCLPTEPLNDIDAFLTLHRDSRVRKFREKVHDLSEKKTDLQEISREIIKAERELQKLNIDSNTIIVAFFWTCSRFDFDASTEPVCFCYWYSWYIRRFDVNRERNNETSKSREVQLA